MDYLSKGASVKNRINRQAEIEKFLGIEDASPLLTLIKSRFDLKTEKAAITYFNKHYACNIKALTLTSIEDFVLSDVLVVDGSWYLFVKQGE